MSTRRGQTAASYPRAGQTVKVHPKYPVGDLIDGADYHVEDYWHVITGKSWQIADRNPAAIQYAVRAGFSDLPLDDEVVYGKIGALGYLVHVSEIEAPTSETAASQ